MPWKDPAKRRESRRLRGEANKEKQRQYQRNWRKQCRLEAIAHYGGKCKCCGEDRHEFLSFDHINGGGSKERQQTNLSGADFARKLKKLGWPDYIRLLCHNCNLSLGFYGYCPHGISSISERDCG